METALLQSTDTSPTMIEFEAVTESLPAPNVYIFHVVGFGSGYIGF